MIDCVDSFNPLRATSVIGVKGILRPMSVDLDVISKSSASRAAKAAAADMVKQSHAKKTGNSGALALYTWGAIAIVSTVTAVGIGVLPQKPGGSDDSGSAILAQTAPETQVNKVAVLKAADKNTQPAASVTRNDQSLDLQTTASVVPVENPIASEPEQAVKRLPAAMLGAEIGRSEDVAALVDRYQSLADREPALFEDVIPRKIERAQTDKRSYSLVVGPFVNEPELAAFCRKVQVRLNVSCETSSFEGQNIILTSQ